jgi:hypothetical protein
MTMKTRCHPHIVMKRPKYALQLLEQFRQMREFFQFDAGQQLLTNGCRFVLSAWRR